MDSLDLDLDNYDLHDILNLFKLSIDFDANDLKKARRVVYKSHPDKSHLDKKYFLFFTKAYRVLESIHDFRGHTMDERATEYIVEENEEEKELLLRQLANKPNFNKVFNELFEKHELHKINQNSGYGEWLQSEEDIDNRKTDKNSMNQRFEEKKTEMKALLPINTVVEMQDESLFDVTGAEPMNYGSGLFSNLQYEDLKKAHIESVIPVNNEDFLNRQQYNNVDELKKERDARTNIPSMENTREILNRKKQKESLNDTQRAFEMAKQDEVAKQKKADWMRSFKQLTGS